MKYDWAQPGKDVVCLVDFARWRPDGPLLLHTYRVTEFLYHPHIPDMCGVRLEGLGPNIWVMNQVSPFIPCPDNFGPVVELPAEQSSFLEKV